MNKILSKDNLKTCMLVQLKNNNIYEVMLETEYGDIIKNKEDTSIIDLDNYNQDLTCIYSNQRDTDIVRVWSNDLYYEKLLYGKYLNTESTTNTHTNDNKPIMEFKDKVQLYDCLNEWKHRLFLDDWIIQANLVPVLEDDNKGYSFVLQESKTSVIDILMPNEDSRSRIIKYCAEQILIHELLHCKYNLVNNNSTYEGVRLDTEEHSLLEMMSRSLLMAKYNLTNDWFANI